jgi:hypothetical protein
MDTHVVIDVSKGNKIVFEGRHQECINYLTNNPNNKNLEIETIEYMQRK